MKRLFPIMALLMLLTTRVNGLPNDICHGERPCPQPHEPAECTVSVPNGGLCFVFPLGNGIRCVSQTSDGIQYRENIGYCPIVVSLITPFEDGPPCGNEPR